MSDPRLSVPNPTLDEYPGDSISSDLEYYELIVACFNVLDVLFSTLMVARQMGKHFRDLLDGYIIATFVNKKGETDMITMYDVLLHTYDHDAKIRPHWSTLDTTDISQYPNFRRCFTKDFLIGLFKNNEKFKEILLKKNKMPVTSPVTMMEIFEQEQFDNLDEIKNDLIHHDLKWEVRAPQLLKKLLQPSPDIMGLQELGSGFIMPIDNVNDTFKSRLEGNGYTCINFYNKVNTTKKDKNIDGNGSIICFKEDIFKIVEKDGESLREASKTQYSEGIAYSEGFELTGTNIYDPHCYDLDTLNHHLDDSKHRSVGFLTLQNKNTNHYFLVVSCHFQTKTNETNETDLTLVRRNEFVFVKEKINERIKLFKDLTGENLIVILAADTNVDLYSQDEAEKKLVSQLFGRDNFDPEQLSDLELKLNDTTATDLISIKPIGYTSSNLTDKSVSIDRNFISRFAVHTEDTEYKIESIGPIISGPDDEKKIYPTYPSDHVPVVMRVKIKKELPEIGTISGGSKMSSKVKKNRKTKKRNKNKSKRKCKSKRIRKVTRKPRKRSLKTMQSAATI
jgi:hypothetical protein